MNHCAFIRTQYSCTVSATSFLSPLFIISSSTPDLPHPTHAYTQPSKALLRAYIHTCSNLDLLLGLENRILYTAIDILEGECRLDQALIRDKRWKNLALLSMSRNRQRCVYMQERGQKAVCVCVCVLGWEGQ
jgi:hypothetical protein